MKQFIQLLIVIGLVTCVSVAQSSQSQILVIGDSHFCGSFGTALHKGLHENLQSDLVHSYGGCGASVGTWIKGGTVRCGYKYRKGPDVVESVNVKKLTEIEKLINELSPPVVVVELGDNMAEYSSTSESPEDLKTIREDVRREVVRMRPILSKIPKGCFWITPTWGCSGTYKKTGPKVSAVVEGIQDGIGDICTVLDSRQSLSEDEVIGHTNDCLHLDAEKAKKWGEDIRDRILMNWVN